jgi:hypothetical protein
MNRNASSMQPVVEEHHPLRTNCLSSRLKLLLLAETKERGRYSELEVFTGIPAPTWRTWWTRGSTPNGALVEAAAKQWPQFAFWLVTGSTDVRCGHEMPALAPEARGYISNWPEEATLRNKKISNRYGQTYLKLLVQIDDTERHTDVEHEIRWETLRTVASRREQEISNNFKVPLDFEEWPSPPPAEKAP